MNAGDRAKCQAVRPQNLIDQVEWFRGDRLFGRTETVVTDGAARQIVVDEDYVRRSILDPNVDIVESYQPLMPSQQGLVTDEEIEALIEYLRTL